MLGALSLYSTTLKEYSDNQIRLLETVPALLQTRWPTLHHHAQAESNALTDPLTVLPNARGLHVDLTRKLHARDVTTVRSS